MAAVIYAIVFFVVSLCYKTNKLKIAAKQFLTYYASRQIVSRVCAAAAYDV